MTLDQSQTTVLLFPTHLSLSVSLICLGFTTQCMCLRTLEGEPKVINQNAEAQWTSLHLLLILHFVPYTQTYTI